MAARAVYNDVLELLPSVDNPTPMVRINRLNPSPEFTLFAKLEWHNPFGSVKDRIAGFMIRDLVERGELSAERGIVEPTSGNTGLSLALACAALGYRMRAVVPNRTREYRVAPLTFTNVRGLVSTYSSCRERGVAVDRPHGPRSNSMRPPGTARRKTRSRAVWNRLQIPPGRIAKARARRVLAD